MTVLPGKRGPSQRYPGHVYRADLPTDLAALRAAGVVCLALLVEDDELAHWSDPTIVEQAARFGLRVERYPIPDGSPPASRAATDAIMASLDAVREHGDAAIACMGGVGRTGTVAACALVRSGWEPDAAMARVRAIRHPTAVETRSQQQFVRRYWIECRSPSASVDP